MPLYDGTAHNGAARAFYEGGIVSDEHVNVVRMVKTEFELPENNGNDPIAPDSLPRCETLIYDDFDIIKTQYGTSLLAHTFNQLLVLVLNLVSTGDPVTHMVMLHADIHPEPGWIDILLEELKAHDADLVSAVVPIKNLKGVTSTAISGPDDGWVNERRLTMKEVYTLPETFSAADCGFPDRMLLTNTGCWISDLSKPWFKEMLATAKKGTCPFAFTIQDKIVKTELGFFEARVIPEDWWFARHIQERGGKVLATRKVKLKHIGVFEYANTAPWGVMEHDACAKGAPLPTGVLTVPEVSEERAALIKEAMEKTYCGPQDEKLKSILPLHPETFVSDVKLEAGFWGDDGKFKTIGESDEQPISVR